MYPYSCTCCNLETVNAAKQLRFRTNEWFGECDSASCSRETAEFQTALNSTHGLPSWLFKRLKKDWPEQAEIYAKP